MKLVLENKEGGWAIADCNQDENQMIVGNYTSVNESELYILNTLSGKLGEINTNNKKISCAIPKFSRDGKDIFLISDEDTEVNFYNSILFIAILLLVG